MRRRNREANDTILSKVDGCLYRLFIEQDSYPENPRKEFDHIGTIISWSRDHHSPDDSACMPTMRSWCDFEDVYPVHKPMRLSEREIDNNEWSSLVAELQDNGQYIILPILHDRDGIAESSRFNTNGYACVSRAAILENWGKPGAKIITPAMREKALACLNAEIEEYNQWANGEVYCIDIDRIAPDEFGEFDETQEGEDLDESCCGFYGFDYAREEGLSILKSLASGSSAEENARNLQCLRELANI